MARKSYTTEQIIGLLRQAEVILSQGKTLDTVIREIGVTRNTYYRWRKDYGGMKMDQAKRLSMSFFASTRSSPAALAAASISASVSLPLNSIIC